MVSKEAQRLTNSFWVFLYVKNYVIVLNEHGRGTIIAHP